MIDLVSLRAKPQSAAMFVPLRYREVGGDVLLTNPFGDWLFVTKEELAGMFKGEVGEGSALYERLASRNFIKARVDVALQADRMARKKRFLDYGPNLHAMVVTLRCNESCVYCHASRADMDAVHTDMTFEVAEKSVELALQSTSPSITIEFQGGEPLVHFDCVKHIVETARQKNRAYGKQLEFTMVSNLALMNDERLAWLVDNKVQICTSIDGPEAMHNKQRILAGGNAYREATKWIEKINKAYVNLGLDPVLYHVEALLTTTRALLPYPKEIVDTYVELGCRALFVRPVDPFGWAQRTAKTVEYPRSDYLAFYRAATDYVLELNKKGVQVLERYAAIFLTKILGDEEPNFLDVRNPGGAVIGQVAYSYDGSIFTSDEGRMVAQMGDPFFRVGSVFDTTYRQLMTHPTTRSLTLASNLDAQPDCVSCTYNPYCGIVPEHAYRTQGSIFGRMRESQMCAVHKGIQDYLFEKLREDDPATVEILRRWTTIRPRTHFVQASAAS
ncbi:MAG: His-Xaa-Ser system radical SAM maturase HxsB [Polyangiaceae bacterium]|nr:His-Xaa-Ser system radical SAM maturase HxsB [Polyangiaceae bacterium]